VATVRPRTINSERPWSSDPSVKLKTKPGGDMLRITQERLRLGLSKAALARRADIDQPLLSKAEAGRGPLPRKRGRLARPLGLPRGAGPPPAGRGELTRYNTNTSARAITPDLSP